MLFCINYIHRFLCLTLREPKTVKRITRIQGIMPTHRHLVNEKKKQTLKLQNFKRKSKSFNSDNLIKSKILTARRPKSICIILYINKLSGMFCVLLINLTVFKRIISKILVFCNLIKLNQ